MTFEFVIICWTSPEADIQQILTGLLAEALENNESEFDEDVIERTIRMRHERLGEAFANSSHDTARHTLFGFTLELTEMSVSDAASIVNDFIKSLSGHTSITHAVKFEDSLL